MSRSSTFLVVSLVFAISSFAQEKEANLALRSRIDAWLDHRFDVDEEGAKAMFAELSQQKPNEVEALLRAGRASIPEPPQEPGKLWGNLPLSCDHVDYETQYFLYVPKSYDPSVSHPLIVIGHGGNGAMARDYARRASLAGLGPFVAHAEREGYILAAPLTERGWGTIGDSIVMSLISKLTREYRIDPDRIYLTGHSMGGHLTWRSGIFLADRWAAIAPMSGGYDYVENQQVHHLFNVPGFTTYGEREPYQINEFNEKIRLWMEERDYPWVHHEKKGGHQIFADEIPKVFAFFDEHARNLYPERVYARGAGTMRRDRVGSQNERWGVEHTWREGRVIPADTFHWVRLHALPPDVPDEKKWQEVWAVRDGNTIALTTRNVRRVSLYLHPKMVDFAKPVRVTVNGDTLHDALVTPDPRTMLELVREFDDRGRIFHARIDLDVATDGDVPVPTHET